MARGGTPLNNAVLLARSQSGSESGAVGNAPIANQIVVKGPSDPKVAVGSHSDHIIHFTKENTEYQFKLSTFEKLLDQLLPHLSLPIDKVTGEAGETYQLVKNAIEQIKTYAPDSYPRIVELVKHKYGAVPANQAPNSLYSYFMGCAKTGELGVCSPGCVGSIMHDTSKGECEDVVLVFEANGQMRAINKLRKGSHVYIYIDPETFTAFTQKHIDSLKGYNVEHVTVLTKCGTDADETNDMFTQHRHPVAELDQYKCPCKGGPKPKPPHQPDHGHDHGDGKDHGKKDEPSIWVAIVTIVLLILIVIVFAYWAYQLYRSVCEIEKLNATESEKVALFREAHAQGQLNITVTNLTVSS